MKDKTQTITFCGVCIFLFCYFLHIFNMPNELTVILGGILCLALVVQQKKLRIDLGICLLMLTLISYYVIINGISGMFYAILYIPPIIYELGNYMVSTIEDKNDVDNELLVLIFIMVIAYTIHGILNSYMWYAGYVVPGTRRWQDFWSGEIVPGTQHVAFFLPALAMFFPSMICMKKRKSLNAWIILTAIFFGYTSLATKSRMSVLIFIIVFFMQISFVILCEKNNVRKYLSNKKVWMIGLVILILVVGGVIAIKDSAVVVAFIENMSKGGGILNNVRFKAQRMALQQIFIYPMGGNLMDLGGISHSHNTWLDMANAAGVIPFLTFTGYTVYTLYELIYLLVQKDISTEIKIMLAGLYGAFFLYFSVEPAVEASIHLVTPWIFVNGTIHGRVRKNKAGKKYGRK